MPTLEERKLVKQGGSLTLSLPKGWVRYNKLKPGDTVEGMANGDLIVRMMRQEKNK